MAKLPEEQAGKLDFDFRNWILEQEGDEYQTIREDDNRIRLVTEYGTAEINFTELEEEITIVEFNIVANKNDEVKFYLHFQMADEEHCKQLYREMTETLTGLKNEKTTQVLLSCSAGLTTAMFAEQLNSMADMMGLDIHFQAVSYLNIFEEAEKYDAIMLAPQIGYLWNRLKETITDKPVLKIPTAVFASYDAARAIQFAQEELKNFYEEKKKKEKKEHCCSCSVKYKDRILSIVLLPDTSQTKIAYRVYDHGTMIDSNQIIKPSTDFADIDHIIDTVLARHRKLGIVGVAVPGVVNKRGEIEYTSHSAYPMKKHLEEKYQLKVLVDNNVNMAAIGFALEHPEYKNILFHSQPYGYGVGGQGIVVNGQLVRGHNGIAGELKYFIRRMQLSDDPKKLIWDEAGALEIVTKSLLPSLCLFGPEIVAVRSRMTPDMDEIKKKLGSFLPEEYMPEFVYISDPDAYMLDGQMKFCADELQQV